MFDQVESEYSQMKDRFVLYSQSSYIQYIPVYMDSVLEKYSFDKVFYTFHWDFLWQTNTSSL